NNKNTTDIHPHPQIPASHRRPPPPEERVPVEEERVSAERESSVGGSR
ncbi:hypothetical protein A2U01_0061799, partial [Trifolium medium]|nr:hypothetical protein [Trifolium medium]